MKAALLFLTLAAALSAQEPDILGDWQGALQAGADKIHLTLHIQRAEGDNLRATVDSEEQGARGAQATSISFRNGKLDFALASVHATYTGTFDTATGRIAGTWSQGIPATLVFTRPEKRKIPPEPSRIDGIWQGVMQVGGYQMHIRFHIETVARGLRATMDSPDQNKSEIPAVSARLDGNTLVIELPNIGAKYQGTVAKDYSLIEGGFTQGGASVRLDLRPTSRPPE